MSNSVETGDSALTARREPNPNSESVDNYLKAILLLGGPEENRVASNALARQAGRGPCLGDEYAAKAGGKLASAGRIRAPSRCTAILHGEEASLGGGASPPAY